MRSFSNYYKDNLIVQCELKYLRVSFYPDNP